MDNIWFILNGQHSSLLSLAQNAVVCSVDLGLTNKTRCAAVFHTNSLLFTAVTFYISAVSFIKSRQGQMIISLRKIDKFLEHNKEERESAKITNQLRLPIWS